MFAVQNGGWCSSDEHAEVKYKKYGRSGKCGSDGKGGHLANHVYVILTDYNQEKPGRERDCSHIM